MPSDVPNNNNRTRFALSNSTWTVSCVHLPTISPLNPLIGSIAATITLHVRATPRVQRAVDAHLHIPNPRPDFPRARRTVPSMALRHGLSTRHTCVSFRYRFIALNERLSFTHTVRMLSAPSYITSHAHRLTFIAAPTQIETRTRPPVTTIEPRT